MKDGNATRAATAAGYSKKSAKQIGHDLLTESPAIITLMEELRSKIIEDGVYNLEAAVKEIDSDLKLARKDNKWMAVVKMVELKAKLHGLLIEQHLIKFEPIDIKGAMDRAMGRVPAQPALEATYTAIEPESEDLTESQDETEESM